MRENSHDGPLADRALKDHTYRAEAASIPASNAPKGGTRDTAGNDLWFTRACTLGLAILSCYLFSLNVGWTNFVLHIIVLIKIGIELLTLLVFAYIFVFKFASPVLKFLLLVGAGALLAYYAVLT